MEPRISVEQWVGLPLETRIRLISIFNIPRSAGASIRDNEVVSDGHTYDDLKVLSTEAIQAFLKDAETDYAKLFNKLIEYLYEEKHLTASEHVKRVEQENVARWLTILKDLKHEAEEKGLTQSLYPLIQELFVTPKKKK